MKIFRLMLAVAVMLVLAWSQVAYPATQSYTNNTSVTQIVFDYLANPLTVAPGQTVTWEIPGWALTPGAIGTIENGKWCVGIGTTVIDCTEDAPSGSGSGDVTGPVTPTPGYLTKWGPSGKALVDGPKIGTFTDLKWCSFSTAGGLQCTENNPTFSGGTVSGATTFQAEAIFKAGPWADIGAGCVGNGSTDDYACMQANITAAIAAGINAGFVPQKHFAIATALEIDASSFTLFGLGPLSLIRQTTSGGNALELAKSAAGGSARTGIKILNMSILGGAGAGKAIVAQESHEMLLENLYVRAGVSSTSGTGIELTTCYDVTINNLIISGNYAPPYSITAGVPQYGIHLITGCNNIWINNPSITSCVQGIRWSGNASSQGGHIKGGYFSGNADYAIYSAVGSSYAVVGWIISGVQMETNATGDIYAYNFSHSSILSSGARVSLNASSRYNTLIGVGASTDSAIADLGIGNTFINCYQGGTTVPIMQAGSTWVNYTNTGVWPYTVLISHNQILTDNGTYTLPIYSFAGHPDYGMWFDAARHGINFSFAALPYHRFELGGYDIVGSNPYIRFGADFDNLDLMISRVGANTLQHGANAADNSAVTVTLKGPDSTAGDTNGGNLLLDGGAKSGSGTKGRVHIGTGPIVDAGCTGALMNDGTCVALPTQASLHIDDILTSLGIASEATHFGTFTGVTIPDNQTGKAAIQALETAIETKLPIVAAAGTVDAITADYTPDITLSNMRLVAFVASGANTSATPTFAPDGLTAHTIVRYGGQALVAGDIPAALAVCIVQYNLANTRWELLNPAQPAAVQNGQITVANGASPGCIAFQEGSGGGTNKITVCAPASTADATVTLPSSTGVPALITHTAQYVATPVIDDPDNFAANFTGDNLYGGTFIANAAGTAALPDPVVGMNFTIVLEGANAVVIDPLGTGTADTIVMNGLAAEADENITSSTSGAMCVFQYRAANSWMATCNGFAEATPP